MLKKWSSLFAFVVFLFGGQFFAGFFGGQVSAQESTGAESSVRQWLTNFDQAQAEAQASGKPILVLFTGTDWCTFCKKLEEEILSKPGFAETIGDRFVLVKLDFPFYKTSNPAEMERNKALQKQFDIRGFPSILILSSNGQKLGSMGYQSTTPKAYAESLLQMAHQ